MSNIIESHFGTLMSPKKIAAGAASSVRKQGAFYVFRLRVDSDDIREYSFTDRQRAESAREVLISHLEQKTFLTQREQEAKFNCSDLNSEH